MIQSSRQALHLHLRSVQVFGTIRLLHTYGNGCDALQMRNNAHHHVFFSSSMLTGGKRVSLVGTSTGIKKCMTIDTSSISIVPFYWIPFPLCAREALNELRQCSLQNCSNASSILPETSRISHGRGYTPQHYLRRYIWT